MADREFEVTILRAYCKGCGLCVEVCEQRKIAIDPQPNEKGIQPAVVLAEVHCTGCLKCALMCPDAAIEIRQLLGAATDEGRSGSD